MSDPVVAKKSYHAGQVGVSMRLSCGSWSSGHVKVEASADITTEQARFLAQTLTVLADAADAKVAAKPTSEDRRKKWRDREIAAGRMVVLGGMR